MLQARFHKYSSICLPFSIAILALLAYANSFPGAFILDDNSIVVENPLVADVNLWRILTTDYWGVDVNSGLYRPLTILSFAVNRLILGAAPVGFHAINVLLHALVSMLLFTVLRRFTVSSGLAWLAAALFAIHPIHIEAIDQVVGRADLLAALFIFAGLWFSTLHRPWLACLGTIFCFCAALLSKENGVVLLGLLPLLDIASGKWQDGVRKRRIGLYLMLLAIMVAWLGWRSWGVEHRVPPDLVEPPFAPLYYMEPLTRVLTALKIQCLYLWKLIWPVDLQAVYAGDRWFAPVESIMSPIGLMVVVATMLFLAVVIWGCRKGHWAGWGLGLYAIAFAPTSNLLVPIGVSMAERLTYLPSAWFCLALAAVLAPLLKRLLPSVGIGILLVMLMAVTWDRNRDYTDAVTLWEEAVERDPANPIAWTYLGESYFYAGDVKRADETFRRHERIIKEFNRETKGYTDYLYLRGNFDAAVRVGLRLEEQGESNPLNRMSITRAYLALGNYEEAQRWLEACREHYEPYALYWKVKGEIFAGLGRLDEAVAAWQKAMSLATYDDLPVQVVELLVARGRFKEAEAVAEKLLERVSTAEAWNVLGIVLAEQQRFDEAIRAFDRAVAIDPTDHMLRENAAKARREAANP